jgi:hypothetical protein
MMDNIDRFIWNESDVIFVDPPINKDFNPNHDPKTGQFTFSEGISSLSVQLRVPKTHAEAFRKNPSMRVPAEWIGPHQPFKSVNELRKAAAPLLYSKTVTHAPAWIEWFGKRQKTLRADSKDDEFEDIILVMQVKGV